MHKILLATVSVAAIGVSTAMAADLSAMPTKATMTVPLLDLKAQYADIRADVDDAVRRVMESARFIGGPEVTGLEEEVARYSQCAHGIGVASGTDALLLALRARSGFAVATARRGGAVLSG